MNSLFSLKKQYIDLLQKYSNWEQDKKEAGELLKLLEIDEREKAVKSEAADQTRLLLNTNEILSPLFLDNSIELPIIELFINNDNFVVYTTEGIYNCRGSRMEKIYYQDILRVDENSINRFFITKPKKIQLFDIEIIVSNGKSVPITITYGISMRPIIYFLINVNEERGV